MSGAGVGIQPQYRAVVAEGLSFSFGFGWDQIRFPIGVECTGSAFNTDLNLSDLDDLNIWTGTAVHVDSATGDDSNTGLGNYR
jgi:hypothetical protein